MNRGLGRLVLLIGTIAYAVVGVLALLSYMDNVAFLSLATLGIVVQVALALPLIAFLFGGQKMPVLPYAKWLALLVGLLAVAGMLGVPRGSHQDDDLRMSIERRKTSIRDDLGARDGLKLKRELAAADKDEEKEVQKKIDDLAKELSDKEKEELNKELKVLDAEADLLRFDEVGRVSDLLAAERRNVLMVIAAFVILAGAWLMDREGPAPMA
ncbi:MAG: hypothetical protein H6807_12635 [Planctomycetes bacterium]|nr:hypothetical protein [Planctomycetota bacterium]